MRDSNTHPLTESEFDELIKVLPKKYIRAAEDVYKYGKKLPEVSKEGGFCKRAFQRFLTNNGTKYMSLRYGFLANNMAKGYTENTVRKKMGFKSSRHLNKLMWDKIRGDIKPSVRWKILKRDNFRCVLCGADATDRKLHIDHIDPVSLGGKSNPKNLRVLCDACNIGRNTDLILNNVDIAPLVRRPEHEDKLNSGAE